VKIKKLDKKPDNIEIKDLGEYIPGKHNTVTLNKLKKFVTVPYYIKWYASSESKKVFPMFMQEISDLNPTNFQIPQIVTRNPFFDHASIKYFIAFKNGEPAGRIMAHIDYNFNKQHNNNSGWFGLFESIEDQAVAVKLLDAAISYLKQNGCDNVIGPAKFNATGEIGCMISGFENHPYYMEPYNAPYYQEFIENYGFIKENDWHSMNTDINLISGYMERILRLEEKIAGTRRELSNSNGFVIRNVDFSNLGHEIKIIRELYNEIWNAGNHPQQTELTEKEFDVLAMGIRAIALEDLLFIVEKDKKPIGVSISLPDVNEIIDEYDSGHKNRNIISNNYVPSSNFLNFKDLKRDIDIFNIVKSRLKLKKFYGTRILILGVKEEFRKTGIDSKLYFQTFKRGKELGFIHGSGSQLADINIDILNPLFKMGKLSMTWRVYSKKIS
jgi:hypothetical protein